MNRRQLRDQLLNVLTEAQKQRKQRYDIVGGEVGFVHFERHQMFNAVLKERQKLGLSPIKLSEIKRVETMACGHIDYSSKFALYCAELVLGLNVQP